MYPKVILDMFASALHQEIIFCCLFNINFKYFLEENASRDTALQFNFCPREITILRQQWCSISRWLPAQGENFGPSLQTSATNALICRLFSGFLGLRLITFAYQRRKKRCISYCHNRHNLFNTLWAEAHYLQRQCLMNKRVEVHLN